MFLRIRKIFTSNKALTSKSVQSIISKHINMPKKANYRFSDRVEVVKFKLKTNVRKHK